METPNQQFIIIAYDGNDAEALNRRMTARPAHLDNVRRLKEKGQFREGGAILDAEGKMIGSMMVVAFPSREELDQWMQHDPYVTGKVWQQVEVKPYRSANV